MNLLIGKVLKIGKWKGGKGMAVNQVRVKINGTWTVLTYNSSAGKYEGSIAAPNITSYNVNANHYYPVTVEATDLAGNITTKDDTDGTLGASLKLTVKEVTVPTITFSSPASGAYLVNNTPSIVFNIVDEANGSGIKISSLSIVVDGGTALTNTSNGVSAVSITNGYQITYVPQTALSDGSHTVVVNITDNDGNAAIAASRTFKVDTVPPTLSITTPANATTYTNIASITVVGVTNDATSSPVTVTVNGTSVTVDGSGNFSKTVTLSIGSNTITVVATDAAGKTSTVTRTVILDQTAPTISAIAISPNPVNVGNSYTISVTVSDT